MSPDDIASLVVIGAVLVLSVACLASVAYVRWVDRQRTEQSRYLDMLVSRDTRVGIAQAVLLMFIAYVLGRLFFEAEVPKIGAGASSVWLGVALALMGWGPIADARQFHADRKLGKQGGTE